MKYYLTFNKFSLGENSLWVKVATCTVLLSLLKMNMISHSVSAHDGKWNQSMIVALGMPSSNCWRYTCTDQRGAPGHTSCPTLSLSFMTVLPSLLKFKKDLKSATPVVVGNGCVVCIIVTAGHDSCTHARPAWVNFSSVFKLQHQVTPDPGLLPMPCWFLQKKLFHVI